MVSNIQDAIPELNNNTVAAFVANCWISAMIVNISQNLKHFCNGKFEKFKFKFKFKFSFWHPKISLNFKHQ